MMGAGCEWLVDAYGCDPVALRSGHLLAAIFDRVIDDLSLHPVAAPLWHQFPGEAGVTGVVLLSESHLTCHTYPEHGHAAFNLYCCRPREEWPWANVLRDVLGAADVRVRSALRGDGRTEGRGRLATALSTDPPAVPPSA